MHPIHSSSSCIADIIVALTAAIVEMSITTSVCQQYRPSIGAYAINICLLQSARHHRCNRSQALRHLSQLKTCNALELTEDLFAESVYTTCYNNLGQGAGSIVKKTARKYSQPFPPVRLLCRRGHEKSAIFD